MIIVLDLKSQKHEVDALNQLRVDIWHMCSFLCIFVLVEAAAEGNLSLKFGSDSIGTTCHFLVVEILAGLGYKSF